MSDIQAGSAVIAAMAVTVFAFTLVWAGHLFRMTLKHLRMLQDKLTLSELARTDASARAAICSRLAQSNNSLDPLVGPHQVPDDVADDEPRYTPPGGEFSVGMLGASPLGAPAGESI